jgi:hypothetical protein
MRKTIYAIGLAALAGVATAQPMNPLPDVCTAVDRTLVEQGGADALRKLLAGDERAYVKSVQQLESRLTPACRRAVLARDQPTRLRCTSAEREQTIVAWQTAIIAANAGNLPQIFASYLGLEQALSPDCWLAVNQPDDPQVRATCSAEELDHMAAHAGPLVRSTYRMLAMNDFITMMQVAQSMLAGLSSDCSAAVDQAAKRKKRDDAVRQAQGRRVSPVQIPQVYDHGGGTLSAPGLGACTPSGCMAF